jgi:hypothetical protein
MKQILHTFKEMIVLIMVVFSTVLSYGQAGFNTTYIVLDSNSSGNIYYDLQANTANPDFDNSNLGAYCEGSASLIFKGAEHNNYKCGGCDITSTALMYRIYPTGSPSGGFVSNSIGYSSGFANGCGGEDQQWSNLSYNSNLLSGLSAGNYILEVFSEQSTTCLGTVYANNGGNNFKATFSVNSNVTYYLDADNDGFGTSAVSQVSCTGAPTGYVANNLDCNDNQLQYYDADGDGFGSMTLVGCGVANNSDCNDNQIQYLDADGDGFGANIAVACGVTNNGDCNDNQLQYYDADGDSFGSMTLVGCGVANNSDCNDNQIQYLDADGDGFGANIAVACGVTNNGDCNDNQLQYYDADGDSFGSMTLVGCGVANNSDCNDNQIQYLDADGDGFGANIAVACGVTNNGDCNDNQLQYYDADGDSFGSMTLVGCGVANNSDCNDNQIQYLDADGDGFGANIAVACGVTNNGDCNDNQLQYYDADGDSFGSMTLVGCGVTNNIDSNDNLITYVDNDNDGFGQNTYAPSGPTNNYDCNDNQLQYQDADGDGFGHPTVLVACGLANNIDSNDNLITYVDNDNDGFGQNTYAPSGPTNNYDCNDNQLQYQDADGDGFGHPTVLVACGLANNIDSNDNLITYVDNDNDGFGQNTYAPSGPTNNYDCNDNQLQYQDADGDGFGHPTVLVACGLANNIDSNDNLITYVDNDNDGFGQNTYAPSGPTNNYDCNDNLVLYQDNDGDGLGSSVFSACTGVTNNSDCNDNDFLNLTGITYYQDADGDGYGNPVITISACVAPVGYVLDNSDCNDAVASINPGAVEICYDGIDQNCDGNLMNSCAVITAQLRAENCGSTLTTLNQVVRGSLLSQSLPSGVTITGYRFRVTNLLTNEVRIVDRSNYVFQLSYTDFAEYNTPYSVEVAVRLNQQWMDTYGAPCTITTPDVPNTVLAATSCGATLAQMNNIIRAVVVPSALQYDFEVSLIEGAVAVETTNLIKTGESFNLLQLSGISIKFGAEYSVRVKVQVPTASGPQWSTVYGAPCSVFTPLAVEAAIEGCGVETGIAPAAMTTLIYASPVGGATLYKFTMTDGIAYTQTYITPSRYFKLSNFNALQALTPGGTYSVTVEVQIYGFYYPGKDCNILVPGGAPIVPLTRAVVDTDNAMGEFKAVAYPNPFENSFAIDLKTSSTSPVSIAIYDMTGRLLETREFKFEKLASQKLGERYPSGVYSVIVNQDEETQTIRVVKK